MKTALTRFGRLLRGFVAELRRLNSARLGSSRLGRLARRDRVRAVKEELKRHHQNPNRCC